MKVLIVSQYFWPENFLINDLVKSLLKRGLVVDVLTGKPNYPEGDVFQGYGALGCQQEKWCDTTIYRVPVFPRKKGAARLAINYLSFVISAVLFAPWMLRKKRYDLIFVYAPSPILQALPAIFIGWLKRCGVILWIQDLWPDSLEATGYVRNRRILGWVTYLVRFIYRHTDLLLIQSKAFEPQVAEFGSGKRVAYYPNSVGRTFTNPQPVKLPDIPQFHGKFCVMFAGNIGAGQAIEVIVEAATLLRGNSDISIIVFGHGSRWEWMHTEIKHRGLFNIHLLGRYPVETMFGFMQKADALLVTLADRSIFSLTVPSKVQAYMAAGRPILASLNGEGARLIKEAKAGFVSPAGDADGLAKSILHLYEMTDAERLEIGENGRQYFKEHFDLDVLTGQLIKHFHEVSEYIKGKQ